MLSQCGSTHDIVQAFLALLHLLSLVGSEREAGGIEGVERERERERNGRSSRSKRKRVKMNFEREREKWQI